MKTCKQCKSQKEPIEFYYNPFNKDELETECKDCFKMRLEKRLSKYKKRDTQEKKRFEFWSQRRKKFAFIQKRKYREENPIKQQALNAVQKAVEKSQILKPENCENCGLNARLHGHHDDYAKPLEIRWLCPRCHRAWHYRNGEAPNGRTAPKIWDIKYA